MRNVYSIVLTLLSTLSFVSAQLERFDKAEGRLSENRIPLEFVLLDDGTEASTAFDSLGLIIDSGPGHLPVVRVFVTSLGGFIVRESRLVNEPLSNDSAGTPITFHSRYPLKRVGLGLTNNNFGSTATITARKFDGTLVGSVEAEFEEREVFVGIESVDPGGFSSFSVDYSQNQTEEQLTLLVIDPVDPLRFTQYVPQVAGGSFGSTSVTTTISITNLFGDSMDRDLQIGNAGEGTLKFFDSEGTPMVVTVDGITGSSFPFSFNVDDGFRREWRVGEAGKPQIGYAVVESSLPVIVHALFTTIQDGIAVDAGIQATSAQPSSKAPFQLHLAENEDLGIALVNGGTQAEPFTVVLSSLSPPASVMVKEFELDGGEHRTLFVSELFGGVPITRFSGRISIRSRDPSVPSLRGPGVRVVATLLKTRNGVAVASLPLGSTQR